MCKKVKQDCKREDLRGKQLIKCSGRIGKLTNVGRIFLKLENVGEQRVRRQCKIS